MKQLLEYLTKSSVSDPSKVLIDEEVKSDGTVNLKLSVAPEDVGTIIGKAGKTIRALRNLVRIKSVQEGKRVNIELTDIGPAPTETPPE